MKAIPVSCSHLSFVSHLFPYVAFADAEGNIELWKVFSYKEFCQRVGVCVIKTKAKTIDEARNYLPLKPSRAIPYAVPESCSLFPSI